MTDQFDYAKSARTALGLLTKFGQDVRLRRQTNSSYNVATSRTAAGGVEETSKGALLDYAPYQRQSAGGLIKEEDKRCLLATEGIATEPEAGDQLVTADDKVWNIIRVNALSPAGVPVLYDMQVRV